jgi:hypothetical protein
MNDSFSKEFNCFRDLLVGVFYLIIGALFYVIIKNRRKIFYITIARSLR